LNKSGQDWGGGSPTALWGTNKSDTEKKVPGASGKSKKEGKGVELGKKRPQPSRRCVGITLKELENDKAILGLCVPGKAREAKRAEKSEKGE